MTQYYPVVVQAGNNLAGDSLGFHAYSLRVDNCTNQWYLEETSLAYIPPYSLGVCLRLYGTGVAILLASAPIGQPQLAPIVGEQVVGVYSDVIRTEVAPSPIRQFTLVQSVSDLTQGAQPATPAVGITRLWAAPNGDLHYLLSSGTDALLLSTTNYAAYVAGSPVGGDLAGTVNNATVALRNTSYVYGFDTHGADPRILGRANTDATYLFTGSDGHLYFYSDYPGALMASFTAGAGTTSSLAVNGNVTVQTSLIAQQTLAAPVIYLNNALTGDYIQNVGGVGTSGAIRYASGGGHSFEATTGGYAGVSTGPLIVNGPIRATYGGYLGQFSNGVSFSSSTINTWLATPVTVSFTIASGTSGSIVANFSAPITASIYGTILYFALALDSTIMAYNLMYEPVANFVCLISGTMAWAGLGAGAHTVTLYIQGNAGTFGVYPSGYSTLNVCETVA